MDIIIQSLGFTTGDTLEGFIREKLNGLKSDNIVRANVNLFMGPKSEPEHNYCEIRLHVPGNDLFVKKNGVYFENAVGECVDVLTQKLNKLKDLEIARKHAEAKALEDAALEAGDSDIEPDLEDVVK